MKRFAKVNRFAVADLLASEFMPILSAIGQVVIHLEGEDPDRVRVALTDVVAQNGHTAALRNLIDELFRFNCNRATLRPGSWLVNDPKSWSSALENLGLELREAKDSHERMMPW